MSIHHHQQDQVESSRVQSSIGICQEHDVRNNQQVLASRQCRRYTPTTPQPVSSCHTTSISSLVMTTTTTTIPFQLTLDPPRHCSEQPLWTVVPSHSGRVRDLPSTALAPLRMGLVIGKAAVMNVTANGRLFCGESCYCCGGCGRWDCQETRRQVSVSVQGTLTKETGILFVCVCTVGGMDSDLGIYICVCVEEMKESE